MKRSPKATNLHDNKENAAPTYANKHTVVSNLFNIPAKLTLDRSIAITQSFFATQPPFHARTNSKNYVKFN